ncbi:MAG: zinc ABC transporter substrate-binding protein [Clostridia bacterium]|nr:zinc ABC transporter substrate-binding protein [Clostridia bacterium]
MLQKLNRLAAILLLCTLILTLSGCAENPKSTQNGINIVTTNFALYDFASAVCGENDSVIMLLPPGAESHDYEVTLKDMAVLEKCDLLFFVGGESEQWVHDALHTLEEHNSNPHALSALDVLHDADKLLCEENVNTMTPEESHDHDHDHHHSAEDYAGMDEHVWTSIPNALLLMDALDDTLAALNENHSKDHHKDYAASLSALDEKFRTLTENTPDPRIIVADRFPFLYMAKEYGIGYYAAFTGCASDTEPSVAVVDALIRQTEETGTKTLFVIEFSNRRTAEMIAAETGAQIAELHSCHNVSAEDFAAGITYLGLMEQNYNALAAAWETANRTQD